MALVIAVAFYLVLVDNMLQIDNRRTATALLTRQRDTCAALPQRGGWNSAMNCGVCTRTGSWIGCWADNKPCWQNWSASVLG